MDEAEHVAFLDRYYSKVHRVYDATRKYYLLGRDALLREIVAQRPQRVVEIGCGTGRNLALLARALPASTFGAVEPCTSMREHATRRLPALRTSPRTAESADLEGLLDGPPDVIFFSYSMSMIQDRPAALARCRAALAPGGRLYVLDFGDLGGLGPVGRELFHRWLRGFHVHPEALEPVWASATDVARGPLSYWKRAEFARSAV